MRVLNMRPGGYDDGRGNFRLRAIFDLELSDDVRLFSLQLMQANNDDTFRTWTPSVRGCRSATFSTGLVQRITELAVTELEARNANGFSAAA